MSETNILHNQPTQISFDICMLILLINIDDINPYDGTSNNMVWLQVSHMVWQLFESVTYSIID